MAAINFASALIPTLCVGMQFRTLRRPWLRIHPRQAARARVRDAERRRRHSHAERGNEGLGSLCRARNL